MIFVTTGTHSQGFDRLIQKMDEIAGKINEEVIMQIGSAKYKPKNAKFFNFIKLLNNFIGNCITEPQKFFIVTHVFKW